MESAALKLMTFLLVALLGISMISSSVSAEASDSEENPELHRLRVQAELLQRITARVAEMSNMSAELKLRLREILAANISAMSREGLNEFVREAEAILAELRRNLDSNRLMGENGVTRGLAQRLRERLEYAFIGLNISKEECYEFRERLRYAWSLGHLGGILRDIRPRMTSARAHNITESIIEFANKSAEWGNMTGLERALNSSSKVLEVLEKVKEKLMDLNASPAAITAIDHAIEKISKMRELLVLVKEKVEELRERQNVSRQEIRELVKNRTRSGLQQLEERLAKYIEELEGLREAAIEKNLTTLADELGAVLDKLRDSLDAVKGGNFSFKQAITVMVEAEKALKNAEKALERISEREELRERLLEQLRERMRELERQRDQLRERLRKLREQLPEDMLHKLEEMEKSLKKASDEMQEASRDLSAGNGPKTLRILEEVKKTLERMEDEIGELESGARGGGGKPAQIPEKGGPGKRPP